MSRVSTVQIDESSVGHRIAYEIDALYETEEPPISEGLGLVPLEDGFYTEALPVTVDPLSGTGGF